MDSVIWHDCGVHDHMHIAPPFRDALDPHVPAPAIVLWHPEVEGSEQGVEDVFNAGMAGNLDNVC